VSRLVLDAEGDAALTLRALLGRPLGRIRWHAVLAEPGRKKERAETFASEWRRRLGPSELVFTQRSEAGRRALAEAAAQEASELLSRDVWR
jgi:hypothetical protein